MAVVNGPIRLEIGMNCGIGAMGPTTTRTPPSAAPMACCRRICKAAPSRSSPISGCRATTTPILTSLSRRTRSAARGSRFRFSTDSTRKRRKRVWSAFSRACHATTYQLGLREKHWREHVKILLNGINPTLDPVLILDPITARQFIDRGGFDTKEKLIRWVHENGTLPAGVCWDYQLLQNEVLPRALNGKEPYATMLKTAADELIRVWSEDQIQVVVLGGETNGYWRIMGASYYSDRKSLGRQSQRSQSVDASR